MAKDNAVPYEDIIDAAAKKRGLSPDLLKGLIEQESNFQQFDKEGRPLKPSTSNALGVMQIIPRWNPEYDPELLASDPEYNIHAGAHKLAGLIGRANPRLSQDQKEKWALGKYYGHEDPYENRKYAESVTGKRGKYLSTEEDRPLTDEDIAWYKEDQARLGALPKIEGVSPEDVEWYLEDQKKLAAEQTAVAPEVPAEDQPSMLGEAWRRGVSGVKQAGQGVVTGALSALGQDELVQQRMAEQEALAKSEAEAEAQHPELSSKTFQNIQDIAEKDGTWEALKQIPGYVGQKIAESAPSTATPLGVGMAVGMVNPALGVAAGVTASIVQEFGFMMDRQIEKEKLAGKLEPEKAAIAAIPAGILDSIADRFTLGMKLPSFLTREVKEGAVNAVTKTFGGEVAKHVTKGVISETPTEIGQSALERWQAGEPVTGPEAKAEYKEAGISAGVSGGAAGAIGGTASYLGGTPTPEATAEEPVAQPETAVEAPTPEPIAPVGVAPEGVKPTLAPTPDVTAVAPEVVEPTPDVTAGAPEVTTPVSKAEAADLGLSPDEFKKLTTYAGKSTFATQGEEDEAYKQNIDTQAKKKAELEKLKTIVNPDETVTIGGKDYTKQAFIKSQILHNDGSLTLEQAEQNFEALNPKGKKEEIKYSVENAPEYKASHRPPNIENGAPLHDVTKGGEIYPADIYSPKGLQYYGTGQDRADKESLNVIKNTKNKPDALVTMYRAVPKDSSINTINNGDWVTLSKTYAKEHGESALDDDYKIISKQVKANELFTNGDSINEFGYWTEPTTEIKEPSYSTAPTEATTGHTTASLSKALSPELKRLVASGKAVIHDTQATLPGTNHPANVKGMTTAEGVTHYVANKLTPSTMESVALHEVGVHAGMEKMLGKSLWEDVKNQALNGEGKEFDRARAAVPASTPAHLKAEETLAYLVEHSPQLSLVRRIVAAIRNFMRSKMGANIKLSEADAHQMAVASMRREATTAGRTARKEGTAFSKEKPATVQTNAFKKWFGNSKLKDNKGEPVIVYHGSDKEFTTFDLNAEKKNRTSNPRGIYTTPNKTEAKTYGKNVTELYARSENPYVEGKSDINDKMAAKYAQVLKDNYPNYGDDWVDNVIVPQFKKSGKFKDIDGGLKTDVMEAGGYDSYKDGEHIVLFNPNQVKSATDNTGAFSTEEADIRYSMKQTFEDEIGSFKKQSDSASDKVFPGWLRIFSASGVYELAGEGILKGGKAVLKATRELAGLRDKMLTEMAKMRRDSFNPYIKKNHKQLGTLGDVMSETTLLGVSPRAERGKEGNIQDRIDELQETKPTGYAQLITRLQDLRQNYDKNLNPESKRVYDELAKYYENSLKEIIAAYENNIQTSGATKETIDKQLAKFQEQMGNLKGKGDYFPLMRFGKFGVAYKDGEVDPVTGKEIEKFTKFDTSNEAKTFLADKRINGYLVPDIQKHQEEMVGDNKTLQKLYDEIGKAFADNPADAQEDLKDFVFQMHLMGKSNESMAKQFIHRKGTPGYSNDVFRAFDKYGMNLSRQLPRIQLGRTITNGLRDIKHDLQGRIMKREFKGDVAKANSYYEAFDREITDALHPKITGPLSNFATGAAFSYYLTSPASAILQLTSVALQGIPSIGKTHGYILAHSAMNAATKMYLGSGIGRKEGWWNMERGAELYKKKHGGYKKLVGDAKYADQTDVAKAMQSFVKEGIVTSGIHAEAFSGKGRTTGSHENIMQKAVNLMDLMSQPFAQMESASRQIVATAAYIANMKSGMTHDQAVESAIDSVYRDMGDFGSTGRSTLTKSDIARVVWQFQQYGAKLLFSMGKSAIDLATKQGHTRKEAIKHLAGLMGMHWIFAGVLGLPAAGMIGAVGDMLKDALDDDEWHNYKADLRSYLEAEGMDRAFINILLDGPLSTLTDIKLSERLGAHEILPIIHESQTHDTLTSSTKENLFDMFGGAAGSLAFNISEGLSLFTKGETGRAIEKLVPNAIIKNALTATRYATEGKMNLKGEEVIPKENFSAYDLALQAMGFSPYKVFKGEESARAAKTDISFIEDKRTKLLSDFRKANEEGDTDKVLEDIAKFNEKYNFNPITFKTLKQSGKTAARAKNTAIFGMNFGKGEAAMAEKYAGMVNEEDFDFGTEEE
jgi:ADP-Ribosyltransferase in polyvalent proteins/Transglycosylase SLT domain